jgi:hypothetical protein
MPTSSTGNPPVCLGANHMLIVNGLKGRIELGLFNTADAALLVVLLSNMIASRQYGVEACAQKYAFTKSMQVVPLKHGLDAHSLMSV